MILLTCLVFGTSLAFAKIGDIQVNEGVTLEVPLSAYDPDGDNLSFSLSNNPSFVSLIDNGDGTGLLIISPDFDDAGTYTQVRITVTDDGSPPLSDYEEITITVNDVSLTYTITATAGPGGSIAPSGAVTVNHGANQTFTIIPDPGYHIADVLVDGSSVGAVPTYTFTNVTADHTIEAIFALDNRPPVLEPIGDKSVRVGETLTFTVNATDPDEDPITYSVEGLPGGATFENQTFTWTPEGSDVGEHQVTFTASDDEELSHSETIIIITIEGYKTKPDKTELKCYNNVFNPTKGEKALIVVELPNQVHVKLGLYNARGNRIKELADEEKEPGTHKYYWDGKNGSGEVVGSGLYFVHIQAGDYKKTKKIVVVK
ncbi:hypothetical protein ES705_02372 [subsurface metagenome]